MVNRIVNATATYSVPMAASELFRAQHRVHEVHERGDAQQQRQQSHGVTYTRSHSATKPSIAANVDEPEHDHSQSAASSTPPTRRPVLLPNHHTSADAAPCSGAPRRSSGVGGR